MLKRVLLMLAFTTAVAVATAPSVNAAEPEGDHWHWPVTQQRQVMRGFEQPDHEYAAGHRGMKIAAAAGTDVMAPTDATVAFRGSVAGRGVLTLETTGGLVITLEPVTSTLAEGDAVTRGDVIAVLSTGGSSPPGQLHVGVRLKGRYLDPLPFFGRAPRAVLYPCC